MGDEQRAAGIQSKKITKRADERRRSVSGVSSNLNQRGAKQSKHCGKLYAPICISD